MSRTVPGGLAAQRAAVDLAKKTDMRVTVNRLAPRDSVLIFDEPGMLSMHFGGAPMYDLVVHPYKLIELQHRDPIVALGHILDDLTADAIERLDALMPLPGKEECPRWFQWSAFGARYPDTSCAATTNGYFLDTGESIGPYLQDGYRDEVQQDIPCPFCAPESFLEHYYPADEHHTLWASDETPVPTGTEIHFHDAEALWWTATHPTRGEERVLFRELTDAEWAARDAIALIPEEA